MKKPSIKKKFLEELERCRTIGVACMRAGIGRATYYRWCEKDPKFKKKAEFILMLSTSDVTDMATSVMIEGVINKDTAIAKWWITRQDNLMGATKKTEDEEQKPETLASIILKSLRENRKRKQGAEDNSITSQSDTPPQ